MVETRTLTRAHFWAGRSALPIRRWARVGAAERGTGTSLNHQYHFRHRFAASQTDSTAQLTFNLAQKRRERADRQRGTLQRTRVRCTLIRRAEGSLSVRRSRARCRFESGWMCYANLPRTGAIQCPCLISAIEARSSTSAGDRAAVSERSALAGRTRCRHGASPATPIVTRGSEREPMRC